MFRVILILLFRADVIRCREVPGYTLFPLYPGSF